jgi:hypothetical protein
LLKIELLEKEKEIERLGALINDKEKHFTSKENELTGKVSELLKSIE